MGNWLRYQWHRYVSWAWRDRCLWKPDQPGKEPTVDGTTIPVTFLHKLDERERLLQREEARFREIHDELAVRFRRRN